MYFVVRYNYTNDDVFTDKISVGFFKSCKKAMNFALDLSYDQYRNTIAIIKAKPGEFEPVFPIEVFDWSEYYECFIPTRLDDIRRRILTSY